MLPKGNSGALWVLCLCVRPQLFEGAVCSLLQNILSPEDIHSEWRQSMFAWADDMKTHMGDTRRCAGVPLRAMRDLPSRPGKP